MAVHILKNRHQAGAEDTKVAGPGRTRSRLWPRRTHTGETPAPATTAPAAPERTVVVERKPRRWRRSRANPVSMMLLAAGWAAAVILALGMLLTWGGANPGNTLVEAVLDAGTWLATPFHDVFTRPNPDHQLYINWGIAAVVYYLLGRILSWLTRF